MAVSKELELATDWGELFEKLIGRIVGRVGVVDASDIAQETIRRLLDPGCSRHREGPLLDYAHRVAWGLVQNRRRAEGRTRAKLLAYSALPRAPYHTADGALAARALIAELVSAVWADPEARVLLEALIRGWPVDVERRFSSKREFENAKRRLKYHLKKIADRRDDTAMIR